MLTTPIVNAFTVNAAGGYISPVKLTLALTTSAVVMNVVLKNISVGKDGSKPCLKYTTSFANITADELMARSMETQATELDLARGAELGREYYYQSPVMPSAGGYLYAWLEVPAGFTGVATVVVAEYN